MDKVLQSVGFHMAEVVAEHPNQYRLDPFQRVDPSNTYYLQESFDIQDIEAVAAAKDVVLCVLAECHNHQVPPFLVMQSDRIYNKRLLVLHGTYFVHFHPFR